MNRSDMTNPANPQEWSAKVVKTGKSEYQVQFGRYGIHDCDNFPEAFEVADDLNRAVEPLVAKAELAQRFKDAGEFLWAVVANASGGDWKKESSDWQAAAEKARDKYFKLVSEFDALSDKEGKK